MPEKVSEQNCQNNLRDILALFLSSNPLTMFIFHTSKSVLYTFNRVIYGSVYSRIDNKVLKFSLHLHGQKYNC